MATLIQSGDRILGEKIVCQYRREGRAILIHATEGHRGLRRIIEGLPAVAVIEKVWQPLRKG